MYKKILIHSLIIFAISTLIHSFYDCLPCFVTSIIIPVNESIWEHLKMIFTSYMILLLIIVLFSKKKQKNLVSSFVISAVFNIIIYLIIYLPIYNIFGPNMIVTLIIYFITILISNYLKYRIQEKKNNKKLNKIMAFSIIGIYIIFTLLSYYPPEWKLFYDTANKMYGVYKFKY